MDRISVEIEPGQKDPFAQMPFAVELKLNGEHKFFSGLLNTESFFAAFERDESLVQFSEIFGTYPGENEEKLVAVSYRAYWLIDIYAVSWQDVLAVANKIIVAAAAPPESSFQPAKYGQRLNRFRAISTVIGAKVSTCRDYAAGLIAPVTNTKLEEFVDQWIEHQIRSHKAYAASKDGIEEKKFDLKEMRLEHQRYEEFDDYRERICSESELMWRFIVCAYQRKLPDYAVASLAAG
ncbi:MAG: hypothetical protein P4L53_09505 [Candidatus Obscuribacterales bacterium]|nr:hypothetical protein [Candidatus Obscuribacterales bacterium]